MPEHIECLVYATGERMRIPILELLAHTRSSYQDILIADTEAFGRCLVLDGIMQTSVLDHQLYDDALLARLRPEDRRILILGGGDGYVARRALEAHASLSVVMVEIDRSVLELAGAHLNPGLWDHPRLEVRNADALDYAREERAKRPAGFSGIILDLTDIPLDPSHAARVEALYAALIEASLPLLEPGGWLAAQAGTPEVFGTLPHLPTLLERLLSPHLVNLEHRDVYLPSYGEPNSFIYGTLPVSAGAN